MRTEIPIDTTTVSVHNVSPQITGLVVDNATIDENGFVTVTGSYTDPGVPDTHTIQIDWGPSEGTSSATVVPAAGGGTFSATHQYLDDSPSGSPADEYPIVATIQDDDGGSETASTLVTVHNIAPVILSVESSATFESKALPGEAISLAGSFADAGAVDTHVALIDWGDETETPAEIVGGGIAAQHVYETGGIFTITVTLIDDDNGADVRTTTAVVTGVRLTSSGELQIVGTNGVDNVTVALKKVMGVENLLVSTQFDGQPDAEFSLDPADVSSITVHACDGDDIVTIQNKIETPAVVNGGAGNDTLTGGGGEDHILGDDGDDILLGGGADDTLEGGNGHDALVGGDGGDTLEGQAGNDVLIGGFGADELFGGDLGDDLLIGGYPGWRWSAMILPQLEQAALFEALGVSSQMFGGGSNPAPVDSHNRAILSVFRCPSDSGPAINSRRGGYAKSNYSAVRGAYRGRDPCGITCFDNGILAPNCRRQIRDVTDGSSNTLFIGERTHSEPTGRFAGLWVGVHGCTPTGAWSADVSVWARAPINSDFVGAFASRHPGGAQFLFGDGSVHFLGESINFAVYRRLAQRNDGQIIGNY